MFLQLANQSENDWENPTDDGVIALAGLMTLVKLNKIPIIPIFNGRPLILFNRYAIPPQCFRRSAHPPTSGFLADTPTIPPV